MHGAMSPLCSIAVLIASATWCLGGGVEAALSATAGTVVLVFVVGFRAARGGLPAQPEAETLAAVELSAAAAERVDELCALGFEPVGEPFTVNQATPGVVVPLVHRGRGVLAAVYEFAGGRSNTDLVTPFADGGMLTTAGVRAAGLLPLPDGAWLQIAAGASATKLMELHEQGLAFARSRRRLPLSVAAIDGAGFTDLVLATLRQQRARFDLAPLRTTAALLWRLLSGRSPHLRPVRDQHGGDGGATLSPLPH